MRSLRFGSMVTALFCLGLLLGETARASDCFEASRALEREAGVELRLPTASDFLRALRDEVELDVGEVYNQGNTQWCWAYSAFHSLRAYYLHTPDDDADVAPWKEAIGKLDSNDAFRAFMRSHFSTGTTGDPINWIRAMKKYTTEPELPEPGYKTYEPHRGSERLRAKRDIDPSLAAPAVRASIAEIAQKIHDSLVSGIAVPYCYPPHCVSIYGGVYEGDEPKEYLIADSAGGRTYRLDARKAHQKLDLIVSKL